VECLDENLVAEHIEGHLAPARRADVERHIDGCAECRRIVSAMTGTSYLVQPAVSAPPPAESADELVPGDCIGSYEILCRAGAGGMGVVYAAHDSRLDRDVALKLLRAPDERRILREARVLAKLSHPNVVAVYEVGKHDIGSYMAMELVDGASADQWLAATPRSWRDIVDVFTQAARGIVAAHSAGVIHRDLKPRNILVPHEGPVKVSDFGLAELVAAADAATEAGTPAYWAPELFEAKPADARSDQFSFCVALWEALCGSRPFRGASIEELAVAVRGPLPEPAGDRPVPAWLLRAVSRGLRADPAARYPSMEALAAAIRPRRRRARIAVAAAVVAAGVAVAAVTVLGPSSLPDPCATPERRLIGIWDASTRARVRHAFAETGAPFADDAYQAAVVRLDGYASSWVEAYVRTCEATHVRGEYSEQALDRRMYCLDGRLASLRALATVLATADEDAVRGAVEAIESLPSLAWCETADGAVPAPPRGVRPRAEAARAKVADASALQVAGRFDEANALASTAAAEAHGIAYAPLEADALYRLASIRVETGELQQAELDLRAAARLADEVAYDHRRAMSLILLSYVVGDRLARPDDAAEISLAAAAAVKRLPDDPELHAELAHKRAAVAAAGGDGARAIELQREAVRLRERAWGADSPRLFGGLFNLAVYLLQRGERAEAVDYVQRAERVIASAYGPLHPKRGEALSLLAAAHMQGGDARAALPAAREAAAIAEATLSADHDKLAQAYSVLAYVLTDTGSPAAAIEYLDKALPIVEARYDAEHPKAIKLLHSLGSAHIEAEHLEQGIRYLERAARQASSRDAGEVTRSEAGILADLGDAYLRARRPREALPLLLRAEDVFERTLSPDHPYVGQVRDLINEARRQSAE